MFYFFYTLQKYIYIFWYKNIKNIFSIIFIKSFKLKFCHKNMKTKKETSLRIFTQLAESVYIAVRICSEGLSCFFHLRLWGLMEKITGRASQASMCEVSTLLQLLRWENLDTFTALILKTDGKQTTDYSLLEYQMLQFGVSICGSGGFTLALIDSCLHFELQSHVHVILL